MADPEPSKRTHDDASLVEAQSRPSQQNLTTPLTIPHSEHHNFRNTDEDILDSLGELCLNTPPIESLPQELLLQAFGHLVHPSLVTAGFPDKWVKHYSDHTNREEDLNGDGFGSAVDRKDLRNICLVSRTFKTVATTLLYRCAHLATAKSPERLLSTLAAYPDLQPLVKHISIPTYQGRFTARFDYAFSRGLMELNDGCHSRHRMISAECEEVVEGSVIKRMMPLLPNLRTLVIPQLSFVDGPIINDLVLPKLTTLRIALMLPPEIIFETFGVRASLRTVVGLRPEVLGHEFPALQRLEICTVTGTWEAHFVSGDGEVDKCGCPLKYVDSLKTTATTKVGVAEWHLLTLERPIFNSTKLHTLIFDGPGNEFWRPCSVALKIDWDLNRFLSEAGSGLRTLSLDWEVHHMEEHDTQLSFFGAWRHLVKLPQLANLTHLTVSLQALFGNTHLFCKKVIDINSSPDAELARIFPQSLLILRISEYIPGVYEFRGAIPDGPDYENEIHGSSSITTHNLAIFCFLNFLRSFWLMRAEGRELWFRRYARLDWHARMSRNPRGRDMWLTIFGPTPEMDGEFERVPSLSFMVGGPYENDVESTESENDHHDEWEMDEEPDGGEISESEGDGNSGGDDGSDGDSN